VKPENVVIADDDGRCRGVDNEATDGVFRKSRRSEVAEHRVKR